MWPSSKLSTNFYFWYLCIYFFKNWKTDKHENISHLFFCNFAQVSNNRLNDGIFPLVLKLKYFYQFFSWTWFFVFGNLSMISCILSSNFYRLWDVLISSLIYQVRLMVVPLLHSAATVRAADELITLQGDLNANWFSILTVEGVAVQLHTANIQLSGSRW